MEAAEARIGLWEAPRHLRFHGSPDVFACVYVQIHVSICTCNIYIYTCMCIYVEAANCGFKGRYYSL